MGLWSSNMSICGEYITTHVNCTQDSNWISGLDGPLILANLSVLDVHYTEEIKMEREH